MKKTILLFVLACILTSCPYLPAPNTDDIYYQEYSKFFPFSEGDSLTYVNESGEKITICLASIYYTIDDQEKLNFYVKIESHSTMTGGGEFATNQLRYYMEVSQKSTNPDGQCSVCVYVSGQLADETVTYGKTTYEMPRKETYTRKAYNITKRNDPSVRIARIEKGRGLVMFKTTNHTWKLKR